MWMKTASNVSTGRGFLRMLSATVSVIARAKTGKMNFANAVRRYTLKGNVNAFLTLKDV